MTYGWFTLLATHYPLLATRSCNNGYGRLKGVRSG